MKKGYWKMSNKTNCAIYCCYNSIQLYEKAGQSRFSIKFKHHSPKVGSQFQMQSVMPETSSKPDKEEVLRKSYQFVHLTGLHKQYLSQRVPSKRKKRDGTCLRDFHTSVLVHFHLHNSRSKHDRWVRDVHKKQKVFGWHLSAFCNRKHRLWFIIQQWRGTNQCTRGPGLAEELCKRHCIVWMSLFKLYFRQKTKPEKTPIQPKKS